MVVSTFPPIVPSTSDPYQYGNDCQLITASADTVSVKVKDCQVKLKFIVRTL